MAVNNRLNTQDVEGIIWQILNGSTELKSMINGGIYREGFRPTNSGKEDISISTINLTQDNPQIGLHNINVYTQALKQTISSREEFVPNSAKLKTLADKIKEVIDTALKEVKYKDYGFRVQSQVTIQNQDSSTKEYYQNMRIQFIIPQN